MKSLKQIARYRLQALATDQYLQGLLHRRRAENLALMGWRPPCDETACEVVDAVIQPGKEEPPRTILVVEAPNVVPPKKERKVKTTDKLELLLIFGLIFGVGTAVLLACMSVAILFFSSGAVSAGGGATTVLP